MLSASPGVNPGRLTFEPSETSPDVQTTEAFIANIKPLIEAGTAIPLHALVVIGADGAIERDPIVADLPSLVEPYELVHGEAPSRVMFEARKAFFAAGFAAQTHNVLGRGTPPEIVEACRAAARMVANPHLQRDAGDELGA
jgi:hypothetical protein